MQKPSTSTRAPGGRRRRLRGMLEFGVVLALGSAPAVGAEAEEPGPPAPVGVEGSTPTPAPGREPEASTGGQGVELERLLQLPDSFETGGERRGGATADEWRSRFRQARESLEATRGSLREVQSKLENAVAESADYTVTAPGAGEAAADAPVSFGLRQDLRRLREQVAREERDLRALEIEADLADVPDAWRH